LGVKTIATKSVNQRETTTRQNASATAKLTTQALGVALVVLERFALVDGLMLSRAKPTSRQS
jgi:hypothetical protein